MPFLEQIAALLSSMCMFSAIDSITLILWWLHSSFTNGKVVVVAVVAFLVCERKRRAAIGLFWFAGWNHRCCFGCRCFLGYSLLAVLSALCLTLLLLLQALLNEVNKGRLFGCGMNGRIEGGASFARFGRRQFGGFFWWLWIRFVNGRIKRGPAALGGQFGAGLLINIGICSLVGRCFGW